MKISLRKLIATVSGLAIAATLPVASMMASAADEAPTLSIVADKTTVKKGDTVTLDVKVTGASDKLSVGNVSLKISFDDAKLEKLNAVSGAMAPMRDIVQKKTTAWVTALDGAGSVTEDGTMFSVPFKVKEDLDTDTVLSVLVDKFAMVEIKDDGMAGETNLLINNQADFATITLSAPAATSSTSSTTKATEGTKATDGSKATDATSATGAVTSATGAASTDATDATDVTDATDATDATDDTDVVVPTEDNGSNGGAQTGESTTLFVLALVLMAGSAVALVGMKKKVFSK